MTLNDKEKISHLAGLSRWCLSILFCAVPLICLGQYSLSFKDQSDTEVLDKVAETFNITFNFNHDILGGSTHTFSVSGDQDKVMSIVERVLHVNAVSLQDDIYALQSSTAELRADQTPQYSFLIIDDEGTTLPFCNVIAPDLGLIFETNGDGTCVMEGYYSDDERIEVTFVGYESYQGTLGDIRMKSQVVLVPGNHVLGEIVLSDFLSSVSTNALGNREVLGDITIAGISDQDVLKQAQLLPGIHSTSESLNDLQIRGGPPDQVSYKWNDIRLLQTSLFYGQVSGVNPFMVDEVNITRNGTSSDQSGQASGSILIESGDEIADEFGVKVFADLLYGNIGLTMPIVDDHLSAKVAYRRSHNYLVDTKLYQNYFDQSFQFGQLANDQFYIDLFDVRGQEEISQTFGFDDLSASVNWQANKKTHISGSYINIGNQFQYDYFDGLFSDDTKSDQLSLTNKGWNVDADYEIISGLKVNILYSGSTYKNDFLFLQDINSTAGEDRFKQNTVDHDQVGADITYKHKSIEVDLGVQNEAWTVGYLDTTRIPELGLVNINSGLATDEFSSFAKVKWKMIPRTIIETGIRYSDFGLSLVDRKFIEPRLHVSHALHPRLTIHAHYGLFHQNLNRRLFSTPLEVEKGVWYLSDERPTSNNFIWVVQNRQSSIGLKYLIKDWKFTIDGYTKKANNIWTSALDFSVEEDPFAFADLSVNGLEFSSHYQNKNWRVLWTYELTDERMDVKLEEEYQIKSPFTQRHKISMIQSYTQGDWSFSGRWRFNSGRRFSKGARFVIQTEPELYYGLEYESILEEQTSPYHSLDLSAIYKWQYNQAQGRYVEFGFHIQNVYNRKNVIKRQYFIDYTKTPFEMSFYDRRGLGFTPNLSIQWSF